MTVGERLGQTDVSRCFLKAATEMAEWLDSGSLFQREGAQEWNALAPELVLNLVTDRLIPSISANGTGVTQQAWSEDKTGCFSWIVL